MSDLSFRFGGYQTPISIHTRSGAALGDALKRKLGDDIDYILDFDITALGHKTGDLVTLTESGDLTFCYMSSTYFSTDAPEVNVLDLPFTYNDRDKAFAKIDGKMGGLVRKAIENTHPKIKVLQFLSNGYRHFTNRVHPIREPKDCIGLKSRTLGSKLQIHIYKQLGFDPKQENIKKFVAKIATSEFDAHDNPLTNIYQFDIHKHHRYITLSGHIHGVCGLFVNRALYEGWPDNVRQAVDEAAIEATTIQRALAVEEDIELLKKLEDDDAEIIHLSDEERQKFVDAVSPIIEEQRAILGSELVDMALS
jgi:TRAP-type transport system periplasmic protein